MVDGFVKNPISALHFIPLSLRRTARTPHSTGFARLELGLITKPSVMMTFYESIMVGSTREPKPSNSSQKRIVMMSMPASRLPALVENGPALMVWKK
jgi:hypothetical protein